MSLLKQILSLTLVLQTSLVTNLVSNEVEPMEETPWETTTHTEISVHDPSAYSIIDENGEEVFYVFGTHIAQAKSTDLLTWEVPNVTEYENMEDNILFADTAENLAETFEWAGHKDADSSHGFNLWAPDVIWNPDFEWADGDTGAYQLYYSASSTWRRSAIATLASKSIEGPYTYVDTILYSGFTTEEAYDGSERNIHYEGTHLDELIEAGIIEEFNPKWVKTLGREYNTSYAPNAIDPTAFLNEEGEPWLVYGSWSGGIHVLPLNPATGTPLYPGQDDTTEDGRTVDRYFGTKISGGFHQSGEGPYIHYDSETGYYYLWLTYGGLHRDGGYNMRLFRSESVTGPYVDMKGNDGIITQGEVNDMFGIKLMSNYLMDGLKGIGYKAPGHNSVLVDEAGNWFNFFHVRFNTNTEMHRLRVHEMLFTETDWPITLPFRYDGTLAQNISIDDAESIYGSYEWLDHGTVTSSEMVENQQVEIDANGDISGDLSGTFTFENDGLISFEIEGEQFNGVIIEQNDEFGKPRIVIAAYGENNQTVWGIKLIEE